jgi:cob(I)alamin adenosyltransferase
MLNQSEEILINAARKNWALNHATQDFIKELQAKQQELFNACMTLSLSSPPDKDAILRNMIQAKTIQNTIDRINKLV